MKSYLLKDLVEIQQGFAFKSKDYVSESNTSSFRMSNIRPGGVVDLNHNLKFLPDIFKDQYKDFLLKEGDLVMAMTDMAQNPKILGIPSIISRLDKNYLLNQRVARFKYINKDVVDQKYLYYYFLAPQVRKYLISEGSGGLQINLSSKSIYNLQVPVPSLQEQEKIVEKLDKLFENIDKNQEKILNLKFLYSQIKDSFINKKLSNEKTRVLSSFSDIQYGYTPDKNSKEKIQVPILRITDIQNNKVDWENVPNVKVSQETFDKFYLKKGDILFARTGGTLGKSYLFNEDKKAIFASYLIRVTNTKSDFNPKFLKYFFESTEYWKQVNHGTIGAAQPFFNGKKLGNLKIPYFNKDEQKLIIKKLDTLSDLIEKLNDLNMLKKNKYSYFQKSILSKEFSYEK